VGIARELHTPLTTTVQPWWIIEHDDGSRGCYRAEELTKLPPAAREVASTAGETTPLEQRLTKLEQELASFRVAMAGMEAVAEQSRPSELQKRVELQALLLLRRETERLMLERELAEESLTAQELATQNALRALDEIDAIIDDPGPDAPAPAPSDAGEEALALQERLDALEQERDGLRQRNAQALEILREAFVLRRGCSRITEAAEDAAREHDVVRELRDALTIDGGGDHDLLLLDLAQRRAQEGALHREILSRLSTQDIDSLVQALELLDGDAAELGQCLAATLLERDE
jgi:hypothetical protein